MLLVSKENKRYSILNNYIDDISSFATLPAAAVLRETCKMFQSAVILPLIYFTCNISINNSWQL